jgi:FkbM family methyltransferase
MEITTKNPIDGSDFLWIENDFSINNLPGLDFEVPQKKGSLKYILEKDLGVIDAGAHIGDYGIPLAHSLLNLNKEHITVYCIDPCEKKCEYMSDVVKLNNLPNVKILNYGLSDNDSRHETCQDGRGGKLNPYNLKNRNTGAWQYKKSPNGTPFTTLDKLYDSKIIDSIGFFWLDAQWMELEILRGADRFLKKHKPYILMEYWPIQTFCQDGVSANITRRGTKIELSEDRSFKEVFENLGISISKKKDDQLHDILLEFI